MNISGFQLLGLGWNLSVRNASAEQSAGAWEKDGCRSWSDARLNSSVFWISYHGTTLLNIIGHFSYLLSGDLVVCQCFSHGNGHGFRGKSSIHIIYKLGHFWLQTVKCPEGHHPKFRSTSANLARQSEVPPPLAWKKRKAPNVWLDLSGFRWFQ